LRPVSLAGVITFTTSTSRGTATSGWFWRRNTLTFAIEPIRSAYAGQFSLTAVVLEAPYGQLNAATCLAVLAVLATGLFLLIRPLLDRKLS